MAASNGKVIPVPSGILIKDLQGMTISAAGISGDTSEKDEYCAITAIHKVNFTSEPAVADPQWKASGLSDKH